MKIKYLGPSPVVKIAPYGDHRKDEVKDYPDEFGEDLLATSKKQKFEAIDGIIAKTGALNDMTVKELKVLLGELEVSYDATAAKSELIALVKANTAESPEEK